MRQIIPVMTMDAPDNALLTAYTAEESEVAFRAIVRRHVNLVFATAMRIAGDRGLAEEITQNVFVALARKAPGLKQHPSLAGWLHRTTVLEARAKVRAELRRRHRETAACEISLREMEGSSPLEALLPILDDGLLELKEVDRTALVLRFFEERSLREVGQLLGMEEDAARKRVTRALDRLTEFFRQRGFALPGAAGTASVLTGGMQAAPAGLVSSIVDVSFGLAPTAGSSLNALLNAMTITKTQTAVVCLLVAALPLSWQWRAEGNVLRTQASHIGELDKARSELKSLSEDEAKLDQELGRLTSATVSARHRLDTVLAVRDGRKPPLRYRWDDLSPFVRVAKRDITSMHLTSVQDRKGSVSPEMKLALQLSGEERDAVQALVDRFLSDYHTAELTAVHLTTPKPEEIIRGKPEETRVFEVDDLTATIAGLRETLFTGLRRVLGADRYEIFRDGLSSWMPVDDEERGLNSNLQVVSPAHRVIVNPVFADGKWLGWTISHPERGSIHVPMDPEDVPDAYRAALQDWIEAAQKVAAQSPERP